MTKQDKKELQKEALQDLFASTSNYQEKEEKTNNNQNKKEEYNITISKYFKIRKDLADKYDDFCKYYNLNKSSSGIDYILEVFFQQNKDEISKTIREKTEKEIENLYK